MGPPDAVRGVLCNALDHKQGGEKVPLPIQGQFNTSRGILCWGHKGKIVTNCVFNKTKGVKRSITSREMGRVLDYPEERTIKMTEELLHLLTQNEQIPGKIVYSSLFSISSLYSEMESGTMSNMKKRQSDSTMLLNGPSQKRLKASQSQIDHLKDESPQLDIEDILEDMDLKIKQKDVEDEDFQGNEGQPSAKAVKADDAKVSIHLWNDRVALKLTEHWKATGVLSKKGNLEESMDCKSLNLVCDVFWCWILKYWKRKVKRDFFTWYELKGKHHKDKGAVLATGKEAICRAEGCSW